MEYEEMIDNWIRDQMEKSTKETEFQRASEVHGKIAAMTPEEFSKTINNTEYTIGYLWRNAEQRAYRMVWNCFQREIFKR